MLNSGQEVKDYLQRKGWIHQEEALSIEQLSGGVSSMVWKITTSNDKWVLKQALAKLKVQADWSSDVSRIDRERDALQVLQMLIPEDRLPHFINSDPDEHLLVMTCAPEEAIPWKQQLLAGRMNADTARNAGKLLRSIHEESANRLTEHQRSCFLDLTYLEQLRIQPFHYKLIEVYPELAANIMGLVNELTGIQECLVHGDYSPKNMLVTPDNRIILLDFEVAHWGNPVMDVSFMLAHLLLKGLALGYPADAFYLMKTFLNEYGLKVDHLLAHLGLMLLARVDGKSPVEYINDPLMKDRVRSIAIPWIQGQHKNEDPIHEFQRILQGVME